MLKFVYDISVYVIGSRIHELFWCPYGIPEKISCVKLVYAGLEHSDWLLKFFQPIRMLNV